MKKVKLSSHSSLEVSSMILGTWGIGGPPFWGERDERESIATIRAAIECGVTTIDTAPVYGFGLSEEIVGKGIDGHRDQVQIATKFGLRWKTPKLKNLYKETSATSIREELELSLKRLKTDRIDLYQIHWPNPEIDFAETFGLLSQLQEEGKIVAIGVSNLSRKQVKEAEKEARIDSIQPCYNMLQREIESDLLPYARKRQIGVIPYSSLASGLLTGKYSLDSIFDDWRRKGNFGLFQPEKWPEAMEKVDKLRKIADDASLSLLHIAIRWISRQEGVTGPIVGANSPDQITNNAKAFDLQIDRSVWESIDAVLS